MSIGLKQVVQKWLSQKSTFRSDWIQKCKWRNVFVFFPFAQTINIKCWNICFDCCGIVKVECKYDKSMIIDFIFSLPLSISLLFAPFRWCARLTIFQNLLSLKLFSANTYLCVIIASIPSHQIAQNWCAKRRRKKNRTTYVRTFSATHQLVVVILFFCYSSSNNLGVKLMFSETSTRLFTFACQRLQNVSRRTHFS